MILRPGPVTEFLKANQGVRENRFIDWVKVKNFLTVCLDIIIDLFGNSIFGWLTGKENAKKYED